jgi:hypothetical protein
MSAGLESRLQQQQTWQAATRAAALATAGPPFGARAGEYAAHCCHHGGGRGGRWQLLPSLNRAVPGVGEQQQPVEGGDAVEHVVLVATIVATAAGGAVGRALLLVEEVKFARIETDAAAASRPPLQHACCMVSILC